MTRRACATVEGDHCTIATFRLLVGLIHVPIKKEVIITLKKKKKKWQFVILRTYN